MLTVNVLKGVLIDNTNLLCSLKLLLMGEAELCRSSAQGWQQVIGAQPVTFQTLYMWLCDHTAKLPVTTLLNCLWPLTVAKIHPDCIGGSLVSQPRSIPQRRYWKRSALQNGMGLVCETILEGTPTPHLHPLCTGCDPGHSFNLTSVLIGGSTPFRPLTPIQKIYGRMT